MKNFQRILSRDNVIRLVVILFSVFLLVLFPALTSNVNDNVLSFIQNVGGDSDADTNIVLINISEDDIENLGGWPLKRSYYALLIKTLSEFNPRSIGVEVFLSSKSSSQSIYNSPLNEEIEKSGNVILSSILNNISAEDGNVYADSVLKPNLGENGNIKTGHISYLDLDGYYIPMHVYSGDSDEYSFAAKLAGAEESGYSFDPLSKVNVNISWESYRSYSVIEYFNMISNKSQAEKVLQNKIIIIGVTDPLIAKSVTGSIKNYLPGSAFHAIALDNLLNEKFINYRYKKYSSYSFLLVTILFVLLFPRLKIHYKYILLSMLSAILSAVLFLAGNIELSYAYFLIPAIMLALYDSVNVIIRDRILLESALDEKAILTKALKSRKSELSKLQTELELSEDSPPSDILNKIDMLKNEIENLKASQDDEEVFEEVRSAQNFEGMVFISDAMQNVVSIIEKIASKNATILIQGESGSGKELVANAIHNLSHRKDKEFVAVNCAALSESLLESELFGHVKGAFTNAFADKKGLFEIADKGTIFLDEIGETSEQFQAKLLRILQSGDYQKVGSSESRHVDVRVITATNKDLMKLTNEKLFREDLYYRLNVININVPSLKERPEDIEILAQHFTLTEDTELKISRSAMKQLVDYEWRGNVRELESAIKRASIFAKTDGRTIIQINDLPEELRKHDKSAIETLILDSLRQKQFSHTSINETAKELGNVSRTIVSENFRGLFFKNYYLSNFDFEKAVTDLSGQDSDDRAVEKVTAKGRTYINNIQRDLAKRSDYDFEEIKKKFNSKYKNLPQRYHLYLDGIIKHLIENDLD